MFCRLNMRLPVLIEVDTVDAFQSVVVRGDDAFTGGQTAQNLHLFGIAPPDLDAAPLRAVAIGLQHERPVAPAAFEKGAGGKDQARRIRSEGQATLQRLSPQ